MDNGVKCVKYFSLIQFGTIDIKFSWNRIKEVVNVQLVHLTFVEMYLTTFIFRDSLL